MKCGRLSATVGESSDAVGRGSNEDRQHERDGYNYAPEYEDCRRIAAEHRVPLKQVMQEALRAYSNGDRE